MRKLFRKLWSKLSQLSTNKITDGLDKYILGSDPSKMCLKGFQRSFTIFLSQSFLAFIINITVYAVFRWQLIAASLNKYKECT